MNVSQIMRNLTLCLVCCLLSWGCQEAPITPLSQSQIETAESVVRLTAPKLQERFRLTPHASNSELGGKVLEVDGIVTMVGITEKMGSVILLAGGTKGRNPIVCWMASERPWDHVAPGMRVTVRGQCQKIQPESAPQLLLSQVTEIDEQQLESMRFQAFELTDSYAKNRNATQDLLGDRWVWVSGKVASVDRINNELYLKGSGDTQVRCRLAGDDWLWNDSLTRNDTVTVLGKIENGDKSQVRLLECLPPQRLSQIDTASTSSPNGAAL